MSAQHKCDPNSRTCVSTGRHVGSMWQCDVHLAKAAQIRRGGRSGYPVVSELKAIALCLTCGKSVAAHALSAEWLNEAGAEWLRVLCGNRIVREAP